MFGSDFVSLPKKLSQAWSAGTITRQLNLSLLDDVHSNWHKQEKKVKMRILLSFLGLDTTKKQELSSSLRRVLNLAHSEETTEAWVSITAQLVHERLFGVSMEASGRDVGGDRDLLGETTETIIERLVEWSSKDSSNDSVYFQPQEFRYLQSSWVSSVLKDAITNNDFNYTGSVPDFIARGSWVDSPLNFFAHCEPYFHPYSHHPTTPQRPPKKCREGKADERSNLSGP